MLFAAVDQHHVAEVRLVDELVERREEVALRRAEAEVADIHPVLDRPAQARGEDVAPSAQRRPEHLDAVQLAIGREAADDPRAGGAVAEVVVCGSMSTTLLVPSSSIDAYSTLPADRGWSSSTPLSMIATLTPAPVLSSQAHSRVRSSSRATRSTLARPSPVNAADQAGCAGTPSRPSGGPAGTRRSSRGSAGRRRALAHPHGRSRGRARRAAGSGERPRRPRVSR